MIRLTTSAAYCCGSMIRHRRSGLRHPMTRSSWAWATGNKTSSRLRSDHARCRQDTQLRLRLIYDPVKALCI